MKQLCAKDKRCNGFSWTRGSTSYGWGCLKKNCKNNGKNGFGRGSHGYYEKRARRQPTKNYLCTLSGDPHIKTFTMRRGYYNHYDMGVFTAFKNRYVHVQVKNGRSVTWRNRAVIHSVYVSFQGKRYAVGINQYNCRTSGNLRRSMRFGSVTVQWSRSCRRRRGDRHFNVKILYKGRNLNGIGGSCIKKPARKYRISWSKLYALAKKKCGKDWKNTIKHMRKRCRSKANMGCYQDQINKICRSRAAKLRAAARAKKLASVYAGYAKNHDKNSKRYQRYQKLYASRARRYLRSAKGYRARAKSNRKSEFKHKSSRKAYLRQRAAQLKWASHHSRKASTYANRASNSYTKAARANHLAASKARSAKYYLKMYKKFRGYGATHRVRSRSYNRKSVTHGRAATRWYKKYKAARAKAKAAAKTARHYNLKIRQFCSLWKRLAGKHARLAAQHFAEAAGDMGHLRKSKKYQKHWKNKAKASARRANWYYKLSGQRLKSYYKARLQRARYAAKARRHKAAGRKHNGKARSHRNKARSHRNRANNAGHAARRHLDKARYHNGRARFHKTMGKHYSKAAKRNARAAKAHKNNAARSSRAKKSANKISAKHAKIARAAAKAAKALGF